MNCRRCTYLGAYTKLMSVQAPSRILDENNQRKLYFLLQFHKTIIGYLARKQVFQMFTDIFLVIILEAVKTIGMKQNKNHHDFDQISLKEIKKGQAFNPTYPFTITLSPAYHIIHRVAFRIIIYPRLKLLPPFPDMQIITFPLQHLYLCLPLIRPLTVKAWTDQDAQMPWNTCHQFLRQYLSARREPLETGKKPCHPFSHAIIIHNHHPHVRAVFHCRIWKMIK